MRLYHHLSEATFLRRLNRFCAEVTLEGQIVTVHVKNTGRLGELLTPGARVWLEESNQPHRKTRFDLVAVEKDGYVVNIDSQAPNAVFREYAEGGGWIDGALRWRGEAVCGDSRFDFAFYEGEKMSGYVEVKGVTLFDESGVAYFPDAPTERGVKHLQGLIRLKESGLSAGVCFILQRDQVSALRPNDQRHPAFGQALRAASSAGVTIRALCCHVTPDSVTALHDVPVVLDPCERSSGS